LLAAHFGGEEQRLLACFGQFGKGRYPHRLRIQPGALRRIGRMDGVPIRRLGYAER
jgi:hypothetical protein